MPAGAGTVALTGSVTDPAARAALLDGGVDTLFHLASVPGSRAEQDAALGRSVNLDATLALFDAAAAQARPPVIVYASSIAALDMTGATVGPDTPLRPAGSYGTHKGMAELHLADLSRRGLVDGRAVRPAGIVARPAASYGGFATAWMSELFRAAAGARAIDLPVRAGARVWLQSVAVTAANLVHAARLPAAALASRRAWTLPATVARVDAVVEALAASLGRALDVRYGSAAFDQPALDASDALALGFACDGDAPALAARVLAQLRAEGP